MQLSRDYVSGSNSAACNHLGARDRISAFQHDIGRRTLPSLSRRHQYTTGRGAPHPRQPPATATRSTRSPVASPLQLPASSSPLPFSSFTSTTRISSQEELQTRGPSVCLSTRNNGKPNTGRCHGQVGANPSHPSLSPLLRRGRPLSFSPTAQAASGRPPERISANPRPMLSS